MRNPKFTGTGVAIITPFTSTGMVDHNSIEKIVKHLIDGGIDYLVALGTTGETPTLSKQEKLDVLTTVFKANNNQLPLVIGAGGNNTSKTIEWIKEIEVYNPSGILSVAPYYNKPNQRGLLAHFSAIAENTNLPIILYNVPGRTASNIEAATVVELAKRYEHIICIKEASGNLSQIMEIENNAPTGFYIVSGDDALTLPMISVGAKGVISVIAQAYPAAYSSMVKAALNGDFDKAKNLHYTLLNITNSIYLEGNPTGIKSLMYELKLCENVVRLPLVKSTENLNQIIKANLL